MSIAQYSGGVGGFGAAALQRARAAGLTDNQIRQQLSAANLTIGGKAATELGGNTDLYQFRNSAGGNGFGAAAVQRAQASGLSTAQIRSSLAMSGLRIGDEAGKILNVNQGKTFLGYSPHVQQSYGGNNGSQYGSRPMLAPRGYGMDGRFSSDQGYSPTLYQAGGANDYDGLNYVFGTNYQGGPDIGGGYSDPNFHRDNYVAPASDPYRPFGGYPAGSNPMGSNPMGSNPMGYNTGAGQTNTTNASQSIGQTGYRMNDPSAQRNSNTGQLRIRNVNV